MNKNPYIFFLSNISFIIGILCNKISINTNVIFIFTITFLILIIILKNYKRYFEASILIYLSLFFIGVIYTKYKKKNLERDLGIDINKISSLIIVSETSKNINIYNKNCDFVIKKIKIDNKWIEINKKILIRLYFTDIKSEYKIEYGDCFEIINEKKYGNLYFLENKYFDLDGYYKYLKNIGINYVYFTEYKNILYINNSPDSSFYYICNKTRSILKDKLLKNINDTSSKQILSNLIFGKNENINNKIKAAYIKTNITHILAISGLHISIIIFLLSIVLSMFNFNKRIKLILILIFVWIYGFIILMPISVLRVLIMATLFIISIFINRTLPKYCFLFNSCIFSLLINPLWIYSAGFLLSYSATFGILCFYDKLYSSFKLENKFINKIISLISVNLSVQILTLPILLHFFKQINLISILLNMIIIPIFTILIFLSFINIIYSNCFFSYILDFLTIVINDIIYFFSTLDVFIIHIENFNMYYVILCYLILFLVNYKYNTKKN